MAFWESLAMGGGTGLFKGAGAFAVQVREAITGESVLSPEQKAELMAQAHAMEMFALQADASAAREQSEVNLADARSGSTFRGGWRPAVGWICTAGLGYNFLLAPILPWFINLFKANPIAPMPSLDMESLMTLLLGMLGLGGLRSWEKWKGLSK